jgi:predicted TIM-barrel fold metal-dependent hydrolase
MIDCHVHAWDESCRIVAGYYTPGAPVPVARLVSALELHDVSGAVLVQPSFLGTNNSYIHQCLMSYPDHLRGVCVVDGGFDHRDLELMDSLGICGMRFNLLGGGDLPDLQRGTWPGMMRFMRKAGWHIELAAPGPRLPALLETLVQTRVPLVVDHFGLPDPTLGLACAGFQRLLAMRDDVVVKVSAPYQLGGLDPATLVGALAANDVRMVWGSDFPHLRHEGQVYATLLRLAALLPDAQGEAEVLYGF